MCWVIWASPSPENHLFSSVQTVQTRIFKYAFKTNCIERTKPAYYDESANASLSTIFKWTNNDKSNQQWLAVLAKHLVKRKVHFKIWKKSNLTKFRSVNALKVAFRQKSIESLAADDLPNSPFDHIGERIEPNEDGSCPPRYVINKKRTYWWVFNYHASKL